VYLVNAGMLGEVNLPPSLGLAKLPNSASVQNTNIYCHLAMVGLVFAPYLVHALYGGSLLVVIAILVVVLTFAFLRGRRRSLREGTWLGLAGARAAFLWNRGSRQNRDLMLFSTSITEGRYRDELLKKSWMQLPSLVQISLTNTIKEIRQEALPR